MCSVGEVPCPSKAKVARQKCAANLLFATLVPNCNEIRFKKYKVARPVLGDCSDGETKHVIRHFNFEVVFQSILISI